MEKTCSTCKETKDVSEFYKDAQRKDGLRSRCKACCKVTERRWRDANKEHLSTYEAQRYASIRDEKIVYLREHRRENGERYVDSAKAWREANPEKVRVAKRAYAVRNPEKHRAHERVHDAVVRGDLPPVKSLPCFVCGAQSVHYHHVNGYALENIFDVIPLCAKCHRRIHAAEKEQKRTQP